MSYLSFANLFAHISRLMSTVHQLSKPHCNMFKCKCFLIYIVLKSFLEPSDLVQLKLMNSYSFYFYSILNRSYFPHTMPYFFMNIYFILVVAHLSVAS